MNIEIDKVYNMDCIDLMREMANNGVLVDGIITDPPYLINYKTGHRQDKDDKFCKAIIGDSDEQLITDYIKLCYDIMKDNTAIYCFCNADKIDVFKREIDKYFTIKNIIIWVKNSWTAGDLEAQMGKQYEMCIYANKGRACFNDNLKRPTDIWYCNRVSGNDQIHQNQKPLDLIYKMLQLSTKKGDTIFDGFMGSFTTAVACHKMQRHFIGAELDKEYFALGQKRLQEVQNQISIFDL